MYNFLKIFLNYGFYSKLFCIFIGVYLNIQILMFLNLFGRHFMEECLHDQIKITEWIWPIHENDKHDLNLVLLTSVPDGFFSCRGARWGWAGVPARWSLRAGAGGLVQADRTSIFFGGKVNVCCCQIFRSCSIVKVCHCEKFLVML